MLQVVDQVRLPVPDKPYEDLVGALGDYVWVLDGATMPRGLTTTDELDARWLVREFDAALRVAIGADDEAGLVELVEGGLRGVARAVEARGLDAGDPWLPTATFAMVRTKEPVRALVVGDSAVLAKGPDGFVHLSDTRLRGVAGELRSRLRELAPGAEANALREQLVRAERAALNRRGGYWAIGANPEAAQHALTRELALGPGSAVLLTTDGLVRAVERYRLFADPEELLEACLDLGIEGVGRRIREHEAEHGEGGDDIAAVLLEWA